MSWYKTDADAWKEIIETVAAEEHRNTQMVEKDTILSMSLLGLSKSLRAAPRFLRHALREGDAGYIGNYDSCLSYSRLTGTWRTLGGARPYIGKEGEISEEEEIKVEVVIKAEKMKETVAAVRRIHPYEEPVINLIPLLDLPGEET